MAKSKSKKNKKVNSSALKPFAKVTSKVKTSNAIVEVVECPPDFPNQPNFIKKSANSTNKQDFISNTNKHEEPNKIENSDFNFTNASEEIYKLGMNTKRQDKQLLKEKEYKFLTGREMKKKGLPFRDYLRKLNEDKKIEREYNAEIKNSGVVVGKSTSSKDQDRQRKGKKAKFSVENKKNNKLFGPAPSIGYMKGGILRVKRT